MATKDPTARIIEAVINAQRIGNTINAESRMLLDALFDQIAEDLRRIDPTGPSLRKWRTYRQKQFLDLVKQRLREVIPDWDKLVRDQVVVAGRSQAVEAERTLVVSLGSADLVTKTPITQARLRAILNAEPFDGRTLREWAATMEQGTLNRISRQIKLGMIAEEPLPDLVARIRGQQEGYVRRDPKTGVFVPKGTKGAVVRPRFVKGVWSSTTRDAEAIVRTAVNFVNNEALTETYDANADILEGMEVVSVLDDRTCFAAGTPILTPAGYRPIEGLRAGDVVVGGSGVPRRVVATKVTRKSSMAVVRLSNGAVARCTDDHLWLTADGVWTEAGALSRGVELSGYVEDPNAHRDIRVTSVHLYEEETTVFDIQVEVDSSFIVAGAVVHNSEICAALSGTVWAMDDPDLRKPPYHVNCRSILAPVIAWERLGLEPPADSFRAARDLSGVDPADADRRVSARRRTGDLGKSVKVPASMTYEQWLRDQSAATQNRVLGVGKARLFRSGDLRLEDLIRDNLTVVPLSELAA